MIRSAVIRTTVLALLTVLSAAALPGCDDGASHIPSTTVRLGPVRSEAGELELAILTDAKTCGGARVAPEEIADCLPFVNRATGEVRVAFQPRVEGDIFRLPLERQHLQVAHNKNTISYGRQGGPEVELIGHDPKRSNQLLIILVDGSGSMEKRDEDGVTRIDKVRQALYTSAVVGSFFDTSVSNGVVLMTFTDKGPKPVGGELEVISDRTTYRDRIREDLRAGGGYTHLYDSVRYAITDLMKEPLIQEWTVDAQPTIIVLTDGFNNEASTDSCGDNAKRLESLLKDIDGVRSSREYGVASRPSVYTVGLGRPFSRSPSPALEETTVAPAQLCGNFSTRPIDNDLENFGIDAASLEWIAAIGGGSAYISQDIEGLAKAFSDAAAERFSWFELRYYVGSFNLRRAFDTTIRLNAFGDAQSTVRLEPSAWLDAPPGIRRGEERWARPAPYRRTAALVMPVLGAMVLMAFSSAAWLNARRAVSARSPVKPPKFPKG